MTRILFIFMIAAASLTAQRNTPFQAEVRGSGNSGKCTIEVNVDGVADISVRGTRGQMRTIDGQPARWVRFQCNAPFPTDGMREFQFKGIDGRGRQTLIQDPRNNRGVAVVRIEDPKGGSEGYTFDLEWKDGNGYGNESGGGFFPGDGGGGVGDIEQAVRRCEDRVRNQAQRQYSLNNITFNRSGAMDSRSNDSISGTFEGYRNNRREMYDYTCRVNFNNGNVRDVQINARGGSSGGFFPGGGGSSWDSATAINRCREAVDNRLRNDGYNNASFDSTNVDNRQGRNDWIVGSVRARRGNYTDSFNFDCQVNLNNGSVRNVNLRRR